MQYIVIRTATPSALEAEVERYLQRGYKLQGGVSIASHGMTVYHAQAMVK